STTRRPAATSRAATGSHTARVPVQQCDSTTRGAPSGPNTAPSSTAPSGRSTLNARPPPGSRTVAAQGSSAARHRRSASTTAATPAATAPAAALPTTAVRRFIGPPPNHPAFLRRHIRADARRFPPAGRPRATGVLPPLYPGGCTPVRPRATGVPAPLYPGGCTPVRAGRRRSQQVEAGQAVFDRDGGETPEVPAEPGLPADGDHGGIALGGG